MKTIYLCASFLLASVYMLTPELTLADQALPTSASQGWGPSWVGGGPPGGLRRPAKFDAARTRCAVIDDQSNLGVGVRFWCDGEIVKGHQYQLLYQVRVQTKKGDYGPLLGNAADPNGITFLVASAAADDKWNGLEGTADITRKDLAGMTNLPHGKTVSLRIEPQLLDQTADKYLTVGKSDAIIVEASVSESGRIESVVSLANWIRHSAQYESDAVLGTLAELDAYDAEGNDIANALGDVLSIQEMPAATKLRFIHVVSKEWVHMKNPALWGAINTLAESKNAELQAAAKQLLQSEQSPNNVPVNPLATPPAKEPANPLVNPPVKSSANPLATPPTNPLGNAPANRPVNAPANPLASAPTRAPIEGLTAASEMGTGRLLVASFDGATSAKAALAGMAERLAGYFDSKPQYLGAYGDERDQLISATFKAKLKGVDVRGVVIASVGPKGGSAAVAFDRADGDLSTLPRLLATLPHGPIAWHEAATADGSIRMQLPEGWLITGGQQGMCDIAGPDGQFMEIGIHATINTPETEQFWLMQQAQIGMPPRPSGTMVAPFTDPAKAVQNVFPQFYKSMAANGLGESRLGEIVESSEAPMPPGLTGKARMVHFTMTSVVNHATVHADVIAYVICSPMANGQWMLYFSEIGAPAAIFNRELPTLVQAWNGYKVSNAELQRRMNDALQNMRETNRIMTESAANARHTVDRCNADFDEVIRGYRTVEDTETGKWSEVDLGWSQKIVEKLNEHSGYSRYKEIPLRDQIFLP